MGMQTYFEANPVYPVANMSGLRIGHVRYVALVDRFVAVGFTYFNVDDPAEGIESLPTLPGEYATEEEARAAVFEWWADEERLRA